MSVKGSVNTNLRWDSIEEAFVPNHITAEPFTIGLIDGQPGKYGFWLNEIPIRPTDPATTTIPAPGMVISGLTYTASEPAPGEFRPDWFFDDDATVPFRRPLVYCNISDSGTSGTVEYYGGGTANTNHEKSIRPRSDIFTSSGAWIKPVSLLTGSYVKVTVIAGGGGGGGAVQNSATGSGNGGGGGGRSVKLIAEDDLAASESVTVGAGGTGGTAGGGTGGNGGSSSFGSHCSATGGDGTGAVNSSVGGAPGIGSSGDINDGLGAGATGSFFNSVGYGGVGGGGGGAGATVGGPGGAGSAYGSGGGGGTSDPASETAGGAGKGGIVIVEYWTVEDAS